MFVESENRKKERNRDGARRGIRKTKLVNFQRDEKKNKKLGCFFTFKCAYSDENINSTNFSVNLCFASKNFPFVKNGIEKRNRENVRKNKRCLLSVYFGCLCTVHFDDLWLVENFCFFI